MSDKPDFFETTFTLRFRKVDYTFNIPDIQYDMRVGSRAAAIRRAADPDGVGGMTDNATVQFSRCCAIIELYLVSASDPWVYGGLEAAPTKKPEINHMKWPRNKINTVYGLGAAFESKFADFRDDGVADDDAPGTETVDSQ